MDALFNALLFQIFHGFICCVIWFTEKSLTTFWWDNVNITRCHMSRHPLIHISTSTFFRLFIYIYATELVLGSAVYWTKRLAWPEFALLVLTLYSIKSLFASFYGRFGIFPLVAIASPYTVGLSSYCYLAMGRLYIWITTACWHSSSLSPRFMKRRIHFFNICFDFTNTLRI